MNKRYAIIVEILWIIIGLISLFISIKEFLNKGKQAWIFLIMALFSFLLVWIRERQRKKL
jgi:hypothetical protein